MRKKDRIAGSYKIQLMNVNTKKTREKEVHYCNKCAEKMLILQTRVMAKTFGINPSHISMKKTFEKMKKS